MWWVPCKAFESLTLESHVPDFCWCYQILLGFKADAFSEKKKRCYTEEFFQKNWRMDSPEEKMFYIVIIIIIIVTKVQNSIKIHWEHFYLTKYIKSFSTIENTSADLAENRTANWK